MSFRTQEAVDGQAGWHGPPRLADRGCCCPAKPVVRVLMPSTCERPRPVDLLLCGHHYLASRAALAAIGAVAIDEMGAVLEPEPTSIETCGATPHEQLMPGWGA